MMNDANVNTIANTKRIKRIVVEKCITPNGLRLKRKRGNWHVKRSRADVLKPLTSNARSVEECCQQRQKADGRHQDPLWPQ